MTARQSIFALLATVLLLYCVPAPAAPPAQLRNNVIVDGDTVRLGDLFNGVEKYSDKVIAYAPAPGRKLVLEATWLYRVARAYRVAWRPTSRYDRAIVERRSHVVETGQIVESIVRALRRETKIENDIEIELDDRAMRLFLPIDLSPAIKVRALTFQPRSGRFSAILSPVEDSTGKTQFPVAGSVYKLVDVPTLSQRLYGDDIIGQRDIVWKSMRVNRLDPRTILNDAKMIGMSPRRPLLAGRAILTTEVEPPTLVRRGKQVTIQLQTRFMRLTVVGRSLENGAKGDVVKVQNIDSGATIEAVVVGPERVAVSNGAPVAVN